MKPWIIRAVAVALLVAAGVWAWRVLFPSPERVIRAQLSQLALTAHIPPNEAPLAKLANARKLTGYFTRNVEIVLNVPGHSDRNINGTDELLEAALAARSALDTLKVEFVDIGVTVDPGGESARVTMTGTATVSGQKNLLAQELAMTWRKIGRREWLIERVETVRTLL